MRALLLTITFFLVHLSFISATEHVALTSGNWKTKAIWSTGQIPGPGDTVTIDGYVVTLDTTITVKRLYLTNLSDGNASLILNGSDTLTVTDDILVTAETANKDVVLEVGQNAVLIVKGNLKFDRSNQNNTTKLLRFYMLGNSKTYIEGDFTFDYQKASTSEGQFDIYTKESALLDVSGKTTLITRDGKDLDFKLEGTSQVILRDSLKLLLLGGQETAITADESSHFQLLGSAYLLNSGGSNHCKLKSGDAGGKMTITGNVTMESTADSMDIKLEAKSATAQLNIEGDIIMNAFTEKDVIIHIRNGATLSLGGNITRLTPFGYMEMDPNTTFIFNGDSAQTIPRAKLPSSGKDDFDFEIVRFENTSGLPLVLVGDMTVTDSLVLTKGNIQTADTALLIIEDNAIISGGSDSAFIEGPVLKLGRTNNQSFLFPLGEGSTYAPLEVSAITNDQSQVMAQFYGDPPPFGNNLTSGIDNISGNQYWSLDRNDKTGNVDVTLHWTDASALGITDPDSLIVVALDTTAETWMNYGNGGTSSGAANDGSITSGDPPPFGNNKLTIGSVTSGNALPVELTKFGAIQQKDKVYLEWLTATEFNTSHFIVEYYKNNTWHSLNHIPSSGGATISQKYTTYDVNPLPGLNYYRLKIVDLDGSFSYSHIEVVDFKTIVKFLLYPNPVQDEIIIERSNQSVTAFTIEVFDGAGQLLYIDRINLESNRYYIRTDEINVYRSGTYFIKITDLVGSYILKFIKQE